MLRPGVVKREKTGFLVSHAVTVPEHGGTLVGPWWYCQDGSNPFAGVLHLSRVPHRNQEPAMPNERIPKKPREQYRLRTRLIHGSFATGRWDYDQHVVPPQ
jgi:hypothetical protein